MTKALTLDEARDALEKARRALASEFRDFARVPGPSGKIAGGMAVRAIVDIARAVYREEAAKTWRTPESEAARQEIAALSDGDRTRAEDAPANDTKPYAGDPEPYLIMTRPEHIAILRSRDATIARLRTQLDEKDRRIGELRPVAWARGIVSRLGSHEPPEYDVEMSWGDDAPGGGDWFPLYRNPFENLE